ncbi:hypothetical protein GE09DRAFT_1112483 [Coniochaeta sp. 2T2.1]|nr:hypothetical protein GE09DRAFT_1112483 [Coniochaeta sp. 2T2.1]
MLVPKKLDVDPDENLLGGKVVKPKAPRKAPVRKAVTATKKKVAIKKGVLAKTTKDDNDEEQEEEEEEEEEDDVEEEPKAKGKGRRTGPTAAAANKIIKHGVLKKVDDPTEVDNEPKTIAKAFPETQAPPAPVRGRATRTAAPRRAARATPATRAAAKPRGTRSAAAASASPAARPIRTTRDGTAALTPGNLAVPDAANATANAADAAAGTAPDLDVLPAANRKPTRIVLAPGAKRNLDPEAAETTPALPQNENKRPTIIVRKQPAKAKTKTKAQASTSASAAAQVDVVADSSAPPPRNKKTITNKGKARAETEADFLPEDDVEMADD